MITCKYCGQELQFLGENEQQHYFNCTFCDMVFPFSETSVDRKRKFTVPDLIRPNLTYKSTKELKQFDTITLFFALKETRAFWYDIKSLLELAKSSITENTLPEPGKEKANELPEELVKEFSLLTKKKFVIENIILERTGFLPSKITDEFLGEIMERGQEESKKAMYIYIKSAM